MAQEIPTNTKNTENPYKQDIYDAYVAWRSIPAFMRAGKLTKIVRDLRRESDDYGELLKVRNQTDFAQKYGVEKSTLTNWNKLIDKKDTISETRRWATKLTSNMLFSLYKKNLDTGNPRGIELWFQLVHGWSSKKSKGVPAERVFTPINDIEYSPSTVADMMRETLKKKDFSSQA